MVDINGKTYNLCLLDTNALSELLLYRDAWMRFFDSRFGLAQTIMCYSVFSVSELWHRQELFEKFIELFSVFPSAILDGDQSIFDKEVTNYYVGRKISPIVIAPTAVRAPGLSPKQRLNRVLEQAGFVRKTEQWKQNRQSILDGILALVKNYPAKSSAYTLKEIEDFVFMTTTEQIGIRNMSFAKETLEKDKQIHIDRFPSLKTIGYFVFYKFYIDQRKPILSDVFDIIIASVLPYVDVFLTEANLSHIATTIQKKHNHLLKQKVYSMKEIRMQL